MNSYNCPLNSKNCHIDIILTGVEMELSGNVSPPAKPEPSRSHIYFK